MRKSQYFEILPEIAWQNSSTLRSPNSEPPGPNEPKKCPETTTFTPEHVCEIWFRLLNIFEKLWRAERIALNWEEEEEKQKRRSQNNFLESHVWSRISE